MSEEDRSREESAPAEEKATGEKLWSATRKTFQSATFQAGRYKRIVQKKIDLASVHKKIEAAHGDLGKTIDDLRHDPDADILAADGVQALFRRLDGLKQTAALLEQEIEAIKAESPQGDAEESADDDTP